MTPVLAFLLAVGGIAVLRDSVDVIPANAWRYQEFKVGTKLPADLDCTFKVDPPARARVELMTRDNLRAFLRGEDHEPILSSTSGTLHQEIGIPGDFALVIVNPDKAVAARVTMKVTLDTTGQSLVKERYVSPQKRLVVILSSFVGFLLIITISARKLLIAMKRQNP